jgi:hypothetical protein
MAVPMCLARPLGPEANGWAGMKSNWQFGAEPPGGAESCLPYLGESPDGAREQRLSVLRGTAVKTGKARHRLGPGSWVGEMKRAGGWGMVSARASFAGVETGLAVRQRA